MPDFHGIGPGSIRPAHVDAEHSTSQNNQPNDATSRKRPRPSSDTLNGLPPKQDGSTSKRPSIHMAASPSSPGTTPASRQSSPPPARAILGKRPAESAPPADTALSATAGKRARTEANQENVLPSTTHNSPRPNVATPSTPLPFGKGPAQPRPDTPVAPFVFTAQRHQATAAPSSASPATPDTGRGSKRPHDNTDNTANKRPRMTAEDKPSTPSFSAMPTTPPHSQDGPASPASHHAAAPPPPAANSNPAGHATETKAPEGHHSPQHATAAEGESASVIKQLKELTNQTNEMQLASAQMNLSNQLTSALVNLYKTQGSSIKNASTPN